MSWPVRLFVRGTPAPQGSKRGFPYVKRDDVCKCAADGGPPNQKCKSCLGIGHPVGVRMVESSKRVDPWRQALRRAAEGMNIHAIAPRVPVRTALVFAFKRPPSHLAGGGAGLTTDGRAFPAPTGHGIGDAEKLERAVNDAISAVWFADDADIVRTDRIKVWTIGEPGLYLSAAPYHRHGETTDTLLEAFGMAELERTGTVTIGYASGYTHARRPVKRVIVEIGDWSSPNDERQGDLFAPRAEDDIPFGKPLK